VKTVEWRVRRCIPDRINHKDKGPEVNQKIVPSGIENSKEKEDLGLMSPPYACAS
jgi:hypothetical protein